MPLLEIKHLWKEYGQNVVLEGVNTSVESGEFITIVGASGCGKTTFLNMLLGTETPTRGSLLLDGKPFLAEPSQERGIVFQRYSVFPHLTVLQNVLLAEDFSASFVFARAFGAKKRQAVNKAKDLLAAVGLDHAANKYPHELSGGMQQRLSIAQSLIKRPRILLLDEPFGALDPGIRNDMHELVLSLWQEHKLTIFMITHDIKEGFHLGTRLWVFDKTRQDPHQRDAYGATITYDLPVANKTAKDAPTPLKDAVKAVELEELIE